MELYLHTFYAFMARCLIERREISRCIVRHETALSLLPTKHTPKTIYTLTWTAEYGAVISTSCGTDDCRDAQYCFSCLPASQCPGRFRLQVRCISPSFIKFVLWNTKHFMLIIFKILHITFLLFAMKVTLVGINSVFEFEVFAAVIVKGTILWDVTPYSLVKAYLLLRVGGTRD
jgi:hypothetical protein